MYNRILKRPMFKRGGSSFQSQGTGITSPYDTPRKRYAEGPTWEEINERRSNIFQPRSEMDFAAEGFSALGDPYKKSGDAKTIGEMLYEGAGQVRKSRAADKALGQSVELANIESDASRLLADEKFERDKEIARISTTNPLLKDKSIPRQIEELTNDLNDRAGKNLAIPGADFILGGGASGVAQGEVLINNLRSGEEVIIAKVVPLDLLEQKNGVWDFAAKTLASNVVYWDPIRLSWFVVDNGGTNNVKTRYFDSYEKAKGAMGTSDSSSTSGSTSSSTSSDASETEIKNNEIKMKITTNLKDVDITDKSVIYDEAQKVGIKIVENPGGSKTWLKDLADNEMTIFTFTEILKKKKMNDTYGHISSSKGKRGNVIDKVTEEIKVAEMATGGRAGYASGTEPDDLNELTSWWKSEVDNSFNS